MCALSGTAHNTFDDSLRLNLAAFASNFYLKILSFCELTAGTSFKSGVRLPCGTSNVPYSEGHWKHVNLDAPATVADFHELAKYRCGAMSLSAKTNTLHFLCGHLSGEDLQRAFNQFSWQWQPNQCYLPGRFGPDLDNFLKQFFKKAEGSKIILVGDSITFEQFLSLRCLLGRDVVSQDVPTAFRVTNDIEIRLINSPHLVNKTTLKVTDEGKNISSVPQDQQTSNYLSNETLQKDFALSLIEDKYTWETFDSGIGSSFVQDMTDPGIYLVLNTGAHWHGNIKGYGIMVLNILSYLQENFRGKRVFYRATGHGHTGCKDVAGPLKSIPKGNQNVSYNWRLFEHYNAIWKYELMRLNDDRFVYLDTFAISEDRADSHSMSIFKTDCLHYCLPGVVDFWNLLLLSFIVHGE